jgi:hypothetical protein
MESIADRINRFWFKKAELRARLSAAAHQGIELSTAPAEQKALLREGVKRSCEAEVDRLIASAAEVIPVTLLENGVHYPIEHAPDAAIKAVLDRTVAELQAHIRETYRTYRVAELTA